MAVIGMLARADTGALAEDLACTQVARSWGGELSQAYGTAKRFISALGFAYYIQPTCNVLIIIAAGNLAPPLRARSTATAGHDSNLLHDRVTGRSVAPNLGRLRSESVVKRTAKSP